MADFTLAKRRPNPSSQNGVSPWLLLPLRIVAVLGAAGLFIPVGNPVRLSSLISANTSLFTCAVSYAAVVEPFTRALLRGWIDAASLKFTYAAALLLALSCAGLTAGVCLSLGNLRLKRLGFTVTLASSAAGAAAALSLFALAARFRGAADVGRIEPLLPVGIWVYLGVFAATGTLAFATLRTAERPLPGEEYQMPARYALFLMALPFFALTVVFSYLPLLGWRYAFYDYKPGFALTPDRFVGFKWFGFLLQNSAGRADILRVLRNTLVMSGIGIATSWLPMVFAIFLTEMNRLAPRKLVQTITTIPNFISWVLVYAVAFAMFSTEGFVNSMLIRLGVITTGSNFLMSANNIWLKMWLWGVWKGLGWSAVIYIASISGIDQQLYEAASIDGAGRFARMGHITLPGLMPTFCVLLLLAIANVLSNGMDQYLVFRNQMNKQPIEVLDLYVYTLGLASGGNSNISLATVVGMFKSLISVTLLFGANKASQLIRGEGIV
ncbi:MAG: ABC transporter permease subunit [Oscillospiraceae bacterium]|jgi:putative aldouronate transport system permease protein|nr:ABC transporter permease subunit [Oscillospiraceae bacterium]